MKPKTAAFVSVPLALALYLFAATPARAQGLVAARHVDSDLAASPAPAEYNASRGYVLNMYHFNIQYVVGSEASMRRIVRQSFEPLVDFYLAHPEWGADFEMQGLMIEYMADKHPEVLHKFRRLLEGGKCELVSFHYADQLLLAFPGHDQKWSIKLNDRILEQHGIRRSGVIFTQEAQYGEGMNHLGRYRGYYVAVMTTGHYDWFQDDGRFPYFEVNGMDLLVNRSAAEPETGIEVKWEFLGDGELVATAGISPYFPGLFRKNPLKLKALENKFEQYEADGYKIASVTDYVRALRQIGVEPSPLRPILDSPWRPNDGSGVFQWMGKYVTPWERDYDIRTRNWQVRRELIAAERAGASDDALAEAWGHMLNAQVSDPTGWYPFPVEINWDYEQMDLAIEALRSESYPEPAEEYALSPGPVLEPPLEIRLSGNAEKAELEWHRLDGLEGAYCLDVSWTGKGDGAVRFPWAAEEVEYSPAFMEHIVRSIPADQLKGNNIHLGLPNGLIGLGGGAYLVRENARGSVAAGLDFANKEVRFEVKNGKEEAYAFRFLVLKDWSAEDALDFANRINFVAP